MDTAVPEALEMEVRALALSVMGVKALDKCRVRKSGLSHLVDIHVRVDGDLTVREGHDIAHAVQDALLASELGALASVSASRGSRPSLFCTEVDNSRGGLARKQGARPAALRLDNRCYDHCSPHHAKT